MVGITANGAAPGGTQDKVVREIDVCLCSGVLGTDTQVGNARKHQSSASMYLNQACDLCNLCTAIPVAIPFEASMETLQLPGL